jgi:membrane protein required for beta-lactamase induction
MGTAHHNMAVVLNKAGHGVDAVPHWQEAEKIFTGAGLAAAAAAAVVARIGSDDVAREVSIARAQLNAARAVLVKAYGADAPEVTDADTALAARRMK